MTLSIPKGKVEQLSLITVPLKTGTERIQFLHLN